MFGFRHKEMFYEISVRDVKQEHRIICCPHTVANAPTHTEKQHNIYKIWTPNPYTVLVLHSSFLPNRNINTDLCDGPVFTLYFTKSNLKLTFSRFRHFYIQQMENKFSAQRLT
jgi:hypothetical protein